MVDKKAKVTEGDVIGEVAGGLGAAVHASVTGTVKGIGASTNPVSITSASVTIQTDREASAKSYPLEDWRSLPADELKKRVKAAGIVGIGGAGFPDPCEAFPSP